MMLDLLLDLCLVDRSSSIVGAILSFRLLLVLLFLHTILFLSVRCHRRRRNRHLSVLLKVLFVDTATVVVVVVVKSIEDVSQRDLL